MILILTDRNDSHVNYLIPKIIEEKLPFFRFNVDVESLKSTQVTFINFDWQIKQNDLELYLSQIACVYHRRTFVELLLDEEHNQSTDFKIWKNEWNKTLLGIYTSLENKPWLNYWRDAYKAENKYLQMQIAKNVGFELPDTMISNTKTDLKNFAKRHNEVALKFMQQDFYKGEDGEFKGLYVNKLTENDLEKFGSEENPIVLQKYVDKAYEVRYTVVGQEHFVCKIDSQKSKTANVDWRRYDIPNTPHEAIKAPDYVSSAVTKLMSALELEYGAIDFIVRKNNAWVFLEINSMGQFLWIEDLTGLRISNAIIKWMKDHNFDMN